MEPKLFEVHVKIPALHFEVCVNVFSSDNLESLLVLLQRKYQMTLLNIRMRFLYKSKSYRALSLRFEDIFEDEKKYQIVIKIEYLAA